jgi:hypothetical protein
MEAVRRITGKPIRVDANEGWMDKEEAIRKIKLAGVTERGIRGAAYARAIWPRSTMPILMGVCWPAILIQCATSES